MLNVTVLCLVLFNLIITVKVASQTTAYMCLNMKTMVLRFQPAIIRHILFRPYSKMYHIVVEYEMPWAPAILMVPKTTGGIRVCIDHRKINAVTIPDRYLLPRMDDRLHAPKSNRYMTTLDLQSGYYQIKVSNKDS